MAERVVLSTAMQLGRTYMGGDFAEPRVSGQVLSGPLSGRFGLVAEPNVEWAGPVERRAGLSAADLLLNECTFNEPSVRV